MDLSISRGSSRQNDSSVVSTFGGGGERGSSNVYRGPQVTQGWVDPSKSGAFSQESFNDHQGSFNDHDGSFSDHQGSYSAHQESYNVHQGSFSDHQGSFNDHQGSFNDHQGPLNDHQGSLKTSSSSTQSSSSKSDRNESDFGTGKSWQLSPYSSTTSPSAWSTLTSTLPSSQLMPVRPEKASRNRKAVKKYQEKLKKKEENNEAVLKELMKRNVELKEENEKKRSIVEKLMQMYK